MRAKDAKTISICKYLLREWHKPLLTRVWGREHWYSSPLRAGDSNPSFKVDTELNLWFDHGMAIGGDVINLVCELHKTSTKGALAILESSWLANHSWYYKKTCVSQNWLVLPFENSKKKSVGEKEKEGYFEIISVEGITAPALLEYLSARCISLDIARRYLKEIHFKPRQRTNEYFALGWPNWDGFEARSRIFKGFVGTRKDITRINLQDWNTLSIFEGFFDFLAFLSHNGNADFQNSVIILNSASLRKRALMEITKHQFSKIYLFLDNDDAGKMTRDFF